MMMMMMMMIIIIIIIYIFYLTVFRAKRAALGMFGTKKRPLVKVSLFNLYIHNSMKISIYISIFWIHSVL